MFHKEDFDNGNSFDWGLASAEYAKYRNDYPEEMWKYMLGYIPDRENGARLLDLGTGTGVVARRLKQRDDKLDITAIDAVENQIASARFMCEQEGIDGIDFRVMTAERLSEFEDNSFDAVTACQCFCYFDHDIVAPEIARVLRPGGRLIIAYISWLPFESETAMASEKLMLSYNPQWTGHSHVLKPVGSHHELYDTLFRQVGDVCERVNVSYTRESWNGRICACRAILPSLPADVCAEFSREHLKLLKNITPESFDIVHGLSMAALEPIK